MDYIAQPKDYWIATNAINITRNALGNPNRVQCSVASGAAILCYIEGVDGLGYDNGHRFRTWPLAISPTYFNSNTEKYVYVAIPRSTSVGTQAVVVFPNEQLDIYGVNANDEQVGSTDYYYIWLQGILTATDGTSNREWGSAIDFGKKGTDEDLYDDTSSDWYQYSKVNEVVTFLKNIAMKAGTTFQNLILGYKELTGVATSDTAYTDSDTLVATPGYVESQYLSKTHESEAQEQIGFLKGLWIGVRSLYEITANGIAKLKLLIVEDVNSQRVQTGEIKSPNYTGDGIDDTGFRLTNAYNGHSKLTIDELYVRMKAVFESLDVRERTYTGGDQIWSCAGNRIIRVDYLGNVETSDHVPQMMNVHADGRPEGQGQGDVYSVPVPGDTYGYSDVKVPWLLRQMPLLSRAKVFARYKKVRIIINEPPTSGARRAAAESPLANIRRARCYFLAKDDDTEVHNWWRINDLARCQTMNLANTTRQTYLSGEDQKAGNIFWWRKVIGVSYEPVTLDDGKQYHYFDVAFDYEYEQSHPEVMATSVMEGSDIPAAQDSVVQFGNTIIEGRMNLMMMEVNGSDAVGYNPTTDAPCLKAYRGVYCFELTKSWVGGHTCKMKLSPKNGYEFYGPNFKMVTEYDVVPVPMDRGLWNDITPTRDDYREHANVRKCYYYDKVSHNGSYWLCSIVDGAHWVDGNGDYISDATYSALTEEQKALCSRKQNYTIEEPSASSIDWTEVVQKGDNMIRLDINNEMDMIPTTAALRIDTARTVETTVRLFDGATEADISAATISPTGGPASSIATFSQAADGKGKKLSWAFIAGQTMAEAYEITISYTYKNVAYTAVFTVSASKGEAVWQLKPSMSAIPFQRNADNTVTPASRAVGLSLLKIDGGSTATYTSVQTGLTVRYSASSMPSSASAGTGWSSGDITVANTAENLYIAMFNASGVLLDRETVPVVKDGENGQNGSDGPYYVEDYGIGASRTSHNDISSWSSSQPEPTAQKPYVWKRSRLYNPNTQTYGDATYVCLTGEKGANGKDGWMVTANPANVIITQALGNDTTQFSTVKVGFTAKKGSVSATVSSLAIPTGQQALSNEFNAAIGTGDDAKKVIVSSPKTYTPQGGTAQYYTEGTFVVDVIVTDPDTGSSVTFNVTVPCYANLLGTWKETVEADVKHEVATSKFYFEDENGNVVAHETIGDFIKSSTENTSVLTKKVNEGKNLLTLTSGWEGFGGAAVNYDKKNFGVWDANSDLYSPFIRLAEGQSVCFSAYMSSGAAQSGNWYIGYGSTPPVHLSDLYDNAHISIALIQKPGDSITVDGTTYDRYYYVLNASSVFADQYITFNLTNLYKIFCPQLENGDAPTAFTASSVETSSQIHQTAEEIEAKVNDTGVNITNGKIDLYADKVRFFKNKAQATSGDTAKIWIDGSDGSLHAVDGYFSGTVNATSGTFTNVNIGGQSTFGGLVKKIKTIITEDNISSYGTYDDTYQGYILDLSKCGTWIEFQNFTSGAMVILGGISNGNVIGIGSTTEQKKDYARSLIGNNLLIYYPEQQSGQGVISITGYTRTTDDGSNTSFSIQVGEFAALECKIRPKNNKEDVYWLRVKGNI